MITLYTFAEAFGLRNVSPFCLKVEMALKFLELDYEMAIEGDPRQAPKGKLPFIEIDGERLPDSEIIFERLDSMTQGGLFGTLTPTEMAQGTAFTRLAEDHLYWMLVASRWLDETWFPNVRNSFFGNLPGPMPYIIGHMAQKTVRKTYDLQGLGRHTLAEQKQFALRDLQALNDVVSESGYIVGGRLTAFDFSVASMLSGLLDQRPATWLNEVIEKFPSLKTYAERIQEEVGIFGRLLEQPVVAETAAAAV